MLQPNKIKVVERDSEFEFTIQTDIIKTMDL